MEKRKAPAKVRGVYERERGSGVWWICYKQGTVRKREKVGHKSDAITLYQQRKTELRAGAKLAPNLRSKGVTFGVLADEAVAWSAEFHPKDIRTVKSRMKAVRAEFGEQVAADIKPQTIDRWLTDYVRPKSKKKWSPATKNRYRALISMVYRQAMRNGRVAINPARLVAARAEDNARIRFITYEEEALIRKIILKRCPLHEVDFDVALETGMRLTEQFTTEWPDVHLDRRQIQLVETKNGSSRFIVLNDEAIAALKVCRSRRSNKTLRVFLTRYGESMDSPRAWFELVMKEAVGENPALADVTWHTFRHTFISRLVMAGVDLKAVQEFAGHKTITMTMRYAHLSPGHKLDAMSKLSAYRKLEARKRAKKRAKK